jgi:predicted metalloprotease with PDZ domain
MSPRRYFGIVLLGCTMSASLATAAGTEPVRYTLRFPDAQTHYVEVEATIPTGGAADVELMMPIWTPGSYLVREYARHVEGLVAASADKKPLDVEKTRKNRWAIRTGGSQTVVVAYRVYGREMGVQSNWIDQSFALVNGASTFLTLADQTARPHEVTLVLPPSWSRSVTGLPQAPGGAPHHYRADDFDILVDSPIYAGNPAVYEFEIDGKKHYLVNEGEGGVWDGPRSARDVEAIVRQQRKFWGQLPYEKYVFFNLLTESGGGLEHLNSTVLMASRWATRTRKSYLGWLNLVSHEFFHTWNVKRLRPVELGPFDYETEVHTKGLWVAEGITSYYDRLFVRRAGLCTVDEYFEGDPPPPGSDQEKATGDIEKLQTTPGRRVQPLETASFDAWIKFYRRDENTPNTAISYYIKGAVVGFLLDARIRKATGGAKSLDDAMRLGYERYSGARGFSSAEFRALAQEVAGADLGGWFHTALETTDELDYGEALDWFGLRFRPEDAKEKEKSPEKVWLGLVTKPEGGRLMVSQVKRETPGFAAGFNAGDEIVAIGDYRVRPEQWKDRLEQYRPGETVSVLVARRDRLIRLEATFAKDPGERWRLEPSPTATGEQVAHRRAWLGEAS